MALRLRPLLDDELPAFIEHGRSAYARELVSQAGLSPADAGAKSETDWARLLPDGVVPDRNYLYVVEDSETGERIGELWWAERENDSGKNSAFLYSIEVRPEYRGRGYGRESMQLFEEDVRGRGIAQVNFTVLGGNDVARSLYRALDYAERAVFMSKNL